MFEMDDKVPLFDIGKEDFGGHTALFVGTLAGLWFAPAIEFGVRIKVEGTGCAAGWPGQPLHDKAFTQDTLHQCNPRCGRCGQIALDVGNDVSFA